MLRTRAAGSHAARLPIRTVDELLKARAEARDLLADAVRYYEALDAGMRRWHSFRQLRASLARLEEALARAAWPAELVQRGPEDDSGTEDL